MDIINSLSEALRYIEDNLFNANLDSESVSKHVYLSSFYFQRLFSIYSNIPLKEYIRNRRLSEAGKILHENKNISLQDLAEKTGYASKESFSKAFKRFHNASPSLIEENTILNYYPALKIKISINGGNIMDYKVEDEGKIIVVVLTKEFNGETMNQEVPKFWNEYLEKGYQKNVPPMLGICFDEDDSKVARYGIGSVIECVSEIPEGFEQIEIEPAKWLKIYTKGAMPKAIQDLWRYVFKEWLPNSKYEVIPGFEFECYDEGDTSSEDYRSGLWIRVKEK